MTMSIMRLQVSVSPLTVDAGGRGLTTVPRGAVTVTGANAPSLGWMFGSVTISMPIHTEAIVTLKTQFTAPPTCGSEPVEVELDVAARLARRDLDPHRRRR